MIWQIATGTGWTVQYIMRKVNYQTLLMMLSDAPRLVTSDPPTSGKASTEKKSKKTVEGFFRSKLEQ